MFSPLQVTSSEMNFIIFNRVPSKSNDFLLFKQLETIGSDHVNLLDLSLNTKKRGDQWEVDLLVTFLKRVSLVSQI